MPASTRVTTLEQAPPLGALLQTFRTDANRSISLISRTSGVSATDVASVELGAFDLDAEHLWNVVKAYQVPRTVLPRGHSRMTVDLDEGWVSVEKVDTEVVESSGDATLLTYLEMIYQLGGLPATTEMPIRAIDLSVLRGALALRPQQVDAALEVMLAPSPAVSAALVKVRRRLTRRSLVLTAAAALTVGAIGTAAYALGSQARTTPGPAVTNQPTSFPGPGPLDPAPAQPEVLSAVVIERAEVA